MCSLLVIDSKFDMHEVISSGMDRIKIGSVVISHFGVFKNLTWF